MVNLLQTVWVFQRNEPRQLVVAGVFDSVDSFVEAVRLYEFLNHRGLDTPDHVSVLAQTERSVEVLVGNDIYDGVKVHAGVFKAGGGW